MTKYAISSTNSSYNEDVVLQMIDLEFGLFKSATDNSAKLNHLSTIIHLKNKCESLSLRSDIYVDVKNFFELYIITLSERSLDYDVVLQKKIEDKLVLLSNKERISALSFLLRLMKLYHLEDETRWCQQLLNSQRIVLYVTEFKVKNLFLLCLSISSYSLTTLTISALFILTMYGIILLPSSSPSYTLFFVKYDLYNNNFYINHMLNIVASLLDLQDDFKVKPSGAYALILLIFFKITITVILLNYLIKEIINRVNKL